MVWLLTDSFDCMQLWEYFGWGGRGPTGENNTTGAPGWQHGEDGADNLRRTVGARCRKGIEDVQDARTAAGLYT